MSSGRHDWTGAPNYVNRIVGRLSGLLDDCDVDLLRVYALLALVKGEQVTEEDVHDAWSVWRTATRPAHPSLVPFDQLPPGRTPSTPEAIRAAAAALGS